MFYQSLIDIDTWNKAKWQATAYFTSTDPKEPPMLGLVFQKEKPALKIFTDLIRRLGKNDPHDELRVSIIEGEINGEDGYSVHIGSNPENMIKRAESEGNKIDADKIMVVSRVHRMIPEPNSPHLPNFKKAYSKHGRYLLIPVTGDRSGLTPHFDLSIGKSTAYLRHVDDIDKNDIDIVIFPQGDENA